MKAIKASVALGVSSSARFNISFKRAFESTIDINALSLAEVPIVSGLSLRATRDIPPAWDVVGFWDSLVRNDRGDTWCTGWAL